MKYLQSNTKLDLTLEAENIHAVKWWVDADFALHPDMKSHTGATMSQGKVSVYSTSIRQKLNTKSSNTAELVGVAGVMPMVLWTRYFLEDQGYKVDGSGVFQDNQSAILSENNERTSRFFVADRVKVGEVSIKHRPIELKFPDPKYFSVVQKMVLLPTFSTLSSGMEEGNGSRDQHYKEEFQISFNKVSLCVIWTLLTKMRIVKKTPKVAALTEVSVCVL